MKTLKIFFVAVAIAAITSPQMFSQSTGELEKNQDDRDIVAAHMDHIAHLVNSDTVALKKDLADSYTFTNMYGKVWTKAFYISLISNGTLRIRRLTATDRAVVFAGGTVAIISCQQDYKLTMRNKPMTIKTRTTAIYENRKGKWLLVAQQNTPIVD